MLGGVTNDMGTNILQDSQEIEVKMKIEYYELALEQSINNYIDTVFKKKDWEIVAIDVIKNRIIIKRYAEQKKHKSIHDTRAL